jgi:hypothetical protein
MLLSRCIKKVQGFDLDRDLKVQATNDKNLGFRIYFVKPLGIYGLK